jgi:hypothetical protein
MEGRDRRRRKPEATMTDDPATATLLPELQLSGYRPFDDEPDPRPLPEARHITGALADIFDALVATLSDTRLEPDLEDLLWGQVNLFHRAAERMNASSTPTNRRRSGASANRTARRSAPSSWNG